MSVWSTLGTVGGGVAGFAGGGPAGAAQGAAIGNKLGGAANNAINPTPAAPPPAPVTWGDGGGAGGLPDSSIPLEPINATSIHHTDVDDDMHAQHQDDFNTIFGSTSTVPADAKNNPSAASIPKWDPSVQKEADKKNAGTAGAVASGMQAAVSQINNAQHKNSSISDKMLAGTAQPEAQMPQIQQASFASAMSDRNTKHNITSGERTVRTFLNEIYKRTK